MANTVISDSFLIQACNVLGETNDGLTTSKILLLCTSYSVEYDVPIPFTTSSQPAPNKRTALLDNLRRFSPEQQYHILKELCSDPLQKDRPDVKKLRKQLYSRYGVLDTSVYNFDEVLATETAHWLSNYPDALNGYNSALEKRKAGIYERNLLDDLRLSLELLLKGVLNNEKSLENQIPFVSTLVQNSGGSKEFCNMFSKLLDYFSKYQNEHVKHNDQVPEIEVDFIVDMTSTFMKSIVKCAGKSQG